MSRQRHPVNESITKWGVMSWETSDGVTPKKAQSIIRECVRRVGSERCAQLFSVGIYAISNYLENEITIPRHIGERVMYPHLKRVGLESGNFLSSRFQTGRGKGSPFFCSHD